MAVIPLIAPTNELSAKRPSGEPIARLVMLFRQHVFPELADKTQATYLQTFKLIPPSWERPSVAEVGAWVTWLRGQYPPPPGCRDSWTVHLNWKNVAALYSWAKDWGFVEGVNPAAVLGLKKPKSRARAILDLADVWPAILGACLDDRQRCLLETARATGCRSSELLALTPSDIVTTARPWHIHVERQRRPGQWVTEHVKTDHGVRSLPVPPELEALLRELLTQPAPEVWVGRGRQRLQTVPFLFPYRQHELNAMKTRCAVVAPGAFPKGDWLHTLRHTLAISMMRTGASTDDIQRQLGHDSPTTTQFVYSQFASRPAEARPVMRAMKAMEVGPTRWGAPPGAGPPVGAPQGEAVTPARATASRVSKRSSPTGKKENTTCSTTTTKRQRALPGLSVGPVVKKPRKGRR